MVKVKLSCIYIFYSTSLKSLDTSPVVHCHKYCVLYKFCSFLLKFSLFSIFDFFFFCYTLFMYVSIYTVREVLKYITQKITGNIMLLLKGDNFLPLKRETTQF